MSRLVALSGCALEPVAFVALSMQSIFNHAFIYWEVGFQDLRERRFLNVKTVPWSDVTRVGRWSQRSNCLIVDYALREPLPHRGLILAAPKDSAGFLAALHQHAPQANFEL